MFWCFALCLFQIICGYRLNSYPPETPHKIQNLPFYLQHHKQDLNRQLIHGVPLQHNIVGPSNSDLYKEFVKLSYKTEIIQRKIDSIERQLQPVNEFIQLLGKE